MARPRNARTDTAAAPLPTFTYCANCKKDWMADRLLPVIPNIRDGHCPTCGEALDARGFDPDASKVRPSLGMVAKDLSTDARTIAKQMSSAGFVAAAAWKPTTRLAPAMVAHIREMVKAARAAEFQ